MDEFKFVVKCLILACLIFSFSQYRSDGVTIEAKVHGYLVSSSVAEFVNESARGAVKLVHEITRKASDYIDKKDHKVATHRKTQQTDTEDIDLE